MIHESALNTSYIRYRCASEGGGSSLRGSEQPEVYQETLVVTVGLRVDGGPVTTTVRVEQRRDGDAA